MIGLENLCYAGAVYTEALAKYSAIQRKIRRKSMGMKVDGNKRRVFKHHSEEPLRLKYAAQILAGMNWRLSEQASSIAIALDMADKLIAQHNRDQEEKERE